MCASSCRLSGASAWWRHAAELSPCTIWYPHSLQLALKPHLIPNLKSEGADPEPYLYVIAQENDGGAATAVGPEQPAVHHERRGADPRGDHERLFWRLRRLRPQGIRLLLRIRPGRARLRCALPPIRFREGVFSCTVRVSRHVAASRALALAAVAYQPSVSWTNNPQSGRLGFQASCSRWVSLGTVACRPSLSSGGRHQQPHIRSQHARWRKGCASCSCCCRCLLTPNCVACCALNHCF